MIIGYIMGIPIDDLVYRIPSKKENKDSQLEIDFEKVNKESELDAELSKMTKKELIEYIKEKNIELEKCNESRKCEIMIKESLRNKLIEKDKEIEEGKNYKIKLDDLCKKYHSLIDKFNKQHDAIDYLMNKNTVLEERNKKLSDGYDYMERLYNGIREDCAKWKNEAINCQYKLRKYQLFDDLI